MLALVYEKCNWGQVVQKEVRHTGVKLGVVTTARSKVLKASLYLIGTTETLPEGPGVRSQIRLMHRTRDV